MKHSNREFIIHSDRKPPSRRNVSKRSGCGRMITGEGFIKLVLFRQNNPVFMECLTGLLEDFGYRLDNTRSGLRYTRSDKIVGKKEEENTKNREKNKKPRRV